MRTVSYEYVGPDSEFYGPTIFENISVFLGTVLRINMFSLFYSLITLEEKYSDRLHYYLIHFNSVFSCK